MTDNPWKDAMNINEALHAPVRIAIMLFLLGNYQANFTTIQKSLDISAGNLSSHLKKLIASDYVVQEKKFVDSKPTTIVSITLGGESAIRSYISMLNAALE